MVKPYAVPADERNNWRPWYPLAALALIVVASTVIGLIVLEVGYGGHATSGQINNPSPAITDISTVFGDAIFVVVAIMVASWAGRVLPEQFGLRRPVISPLRVVGLVVGGFVAFLLFTLLWQLIINQHSNERYLVKDVGAKSGTLGVLAACLIICVIAPVCEEFLFRGFIYGALRSWRGPALAAVLTGVLFGAIHATSAPVIDLFPLAFFGMALCAIREYTRSLYPGIATHALNNVVTLVVTAGWGLGAFVGVLIGSFALLALVVRVGERSLRLRVV